MEKIVFEDLPSTKTPLNANNLNTIQENVETAINETNTNLKTLINGIVESGENENGEYIKFADGTMICTQNFVLTVQITSGGTNGYYARVESGIPDYPQTFKKVYYANVSIFNNNTASIVPYNNEKNIGSQLNKIADKLYFYSPQRIDTEIEFVQTIAIGRWK